MIGRHLPLIRAQKTAPLAAAEAEINVKQRKIDTAAAAKTAATTKERNAKTATYKSKQRKLRKVAYPNPKKKKAVPDGYRKDKKKAKNADNYSKTRDDRKAKILAGLQKKMDKQQAKWAQAAANKGFKKAGGKGSAMSVPKYWHIEKKVKRRERVRFTKGGAPTTKPKVPKVKVYKAGLGIVLKKKEMRRDPPQTSPSPAPGYAQGAKGYDTKNGPGKK